MLPPLTVIGNQTRYEAEILPGNHVLIDADSLKASLVQKGTYQDLFAAVAGTYGGNPTAGSFSVRGVNQDGLYFIVGTASNPLVSVMEDGAPLSVKTLRYLPPVLWDIDSVELLRGPQFLTQGPNGLGGALLLHTTPPAFERDGHTRLEATANNTFRGGISQDFLLLPDELALRLSAYHQESDGEVTNLYYSDDLFGATRRDRYQARLRWIPQKSRDARYDLSLVHDESRGNPFSNVKASNAKTVPGYDLFDRKTSLNLDPSYPARRAAAILNATFELPRALELKSTTALQRLDVDPHFDFDETSIRAWVAYGEIDELRLTQDLSIASDEGPFQWLAGGYFETSGYDLGYTGTGIEIEPKPEGSPFRSLGEEEVLVLALYGRGDWQFQNNLHLTGGLRLDHSQHDLNAAATVGSRPETESTAENADTEWLPQLGLAWRPEEGKTIGLQLSRGYRSGGVSYAPSLGTSSSYGPEHSWELELYGKMKPHDSLALSAAVYHSWIEDQQIRLDPTDPRSLPTIDYYIANAAQSHRYGSEVEARWQPLEPLTFTSALGWCHTVFDDLTINGADRSGQSFPNAPEWTASLGTSYQHASGIFFNLLYSFADAAYTDPNAPLVTAVESRRLLSARLGYSWDHASVYLFGNNLLDDKYALARFDNSSQGLPVSGQIGPARSFGIGCEFKW